MNIVFLSGGAREGALRYLLERGETITAVVTPVPSPSNRRFLGVTAVAREFGVPVHEVTRATVTSTLQSLVCDVFVSCGFTLVLEPGALAHAKYAINVHPTLLPKYRGARSGPYVIINGEHETGVTVHFITPELDAGDVLAQERIPVTPFDTTKSLYRKTQAVEPALLHRVLTALKTGTWKAEPQDQSQATTYGDLRTPEDSVIDWSKPLKELYNEIRACDPDDYPAFFYVDGQKVCIRLWRPRKPADEPDTI